MIPQKKYRLKSIRVTMREGDPWHSCQVRILHRVTRRSETVYVCALQDKSWRGIATGKRTAHRTFKHSELW